MNPTWLLALLAHVSLSLQHLTYQDLSQGVWSVEGQHPWGRSVVSLHYKNDQFLQRWRWQQEGFWAWAPWPVEIRWGYVQEGSRHSRSHQVSGEVQYRYRWHTWHLIPGIRAHRFATVQGARTDLGPTLQVEGPIYQGIASLHLRYTTLFRRASAQWRRPGTPMVSLRLLDFRYPLSRETEHQQEASLALGGRWEGTLGEVALDLTGEHRRFQWDQVRSGTRLEGRFHLEIHHHRRKAGLEVRRSFYRYTRFSGLSQIQEHVLYTETQERVHGGTFEARLQVSLQRKDPPAVFAFNRRDRRVLRTEARWSTPQEAHGLPQVDLQFVGKITDEVYLHPTRSAYSRQDQTYRLRATTATLRWIHHTEIAALYSLYRFAPARNLLVRYLQSELEFPGTWFRAALRFRWQQNGTYLEEPQRGRWVFVVRRETAEGRAALRLRTVRVASGAGWLLWELLDRQERTPGDRFRRQQREWAAGAMVEAASLRGEVKRIRRNQAPPFWAVSLSWQVRW